MPSVDWDAMEENARREEEPLPLGVPLTAVSEQAQWVEKNGKVRFNLRLRVTQGPHKGKVLYHPIWVNQDERGASQTMREMSMFGLTKHLLKTASEDEQCKRAVGHTVVIELEEKNGYNRTKRISKPETASNIPPRRED